MKTNKMTYQVILLLGGSSHRFNDKQNKVLYEINNKPIYRYSLDIFLNDDRCERVVIVLNELIKDIIKSEITSSKVVYALGGEERYLSVANGLEYITSDYVLVHDGARPVIDNDLVHNILDELENFPVVSLGIKSSNTLKEVKNGNVIRTIPREDVYEMQTPQGAQTNILKSALAKVKKNDYITDDLMSIEKYTNIVPKIIEGKRSNIKLTTKEDVELIEYYLSKGKSKMMRIGQSKDIHRLISNRKLIIGQVDIPFEKGIEAHSDGDVLLHAITEAIIGALGLGDMGTFFPDTSDDYLNISSSYFLNKAKEMLKEKGYTICNIDSTVILEKPHLHPFIEKMKENISKILEVDKDIINIKATRGEKLGYVGTGEGVEALATVLITK